MTKKGLLEKTLCEATLVLWHIALIANRSGDLQSRLRQLLQSILPLALGRIAIFSICQSNWAGFGAFSARSHRQWSKLSNQFAGTSSHLRALDTALEQVVRGIGADF